jgi:hypothetical protein
MQTYKKVHLHFFSNPKIDLHRRSIVFVRLYHLYNNIPTHFNKEYLRKEFL